MKYLLLLVSFFLLSIPVHAQALTAYEKDQVLLCVEAYKANLILYCHGGKNKRRLRDNLIHLFIKEQITDGESDHVIDYDALGDGASPEEPITFYLRKIDEKYNFQIDIRFIKGQLLNCVDSAYHSRMAVYSLEKSIARNGKVSVHPEVILVNLPKNVTDTNAYKIYSIKSAANFRYNKKRHYLCGDLIDVRAEDNERLKIQDQADTLFSHQKNYLEAMEIYMYLANRYPYDDYLQNQINACRDSLPQDVFLTQGRKYLDQKEYARSINWYTWHLNIHPHQVDNQSVSDTIILARQASAAVNYDSDIKKAQEEADQSNFGNASFYYEDALKYKPGDQVALSRLKYTKAKDVQYANKKIDSVVRLYNLDKGKYAGSYFKVLRDFEGYGNHISTIQYLNMAALLFNNNRLVRRELDFKDNNDYKNYLKTYYKKLNDAYYQETDPKIKEEVKQFLNNVVGLHTKTNFHD